MSRWPLESRGPTVADDRQAREEKVIDAVRVETRFYLDVEVQAEPPDRDGWAWATWPDGRRFRHWAAQLTTTPWGKPERRTHDPA